MSTTTIALEPQNLAAAAQSLRAEFLKAKLSGVKTRAAKGAVQIQIPIARLADYQFACADAYCSWSNSHRKVVVQVKGFSVEQKAKKNFLLLVFKHSGSPKGTSPSRPGHRAGANLKANGEVMPQWQFEEVDLSAYYLTRRHPSRVVELFLDHCAENAEVLTGEPTARRLPRDQV